MSIRPDRIHKANADRVDLVAGIASGYGEHGLANQLWQFEAELRKRAQDEIRRQEQRRREIEQTPGQPINERLAMGIVRDRLRERGITQATAAEAIGISEKHISQILTGKTGASFGLLERLLAYVGLQLTIATTGDDA